MGQPLSVTDGQIAAIAASQGFAVATRNVKDFAELPVPLIDPFQSLS